MTNSGVSPEYINLQGITEKVRPKNLKKSRLYLRAINQLNEFVPDLAAECFPFRIILKKDADWK